MTQDREQEIKKVKAWLFIFATEIGANDHILEMPKDYLGKASSSCIALFTNILGYRKVAPELKEAYNKGYQDGLAHNYTHRFDQRQIEGKEWH